MCHRRKLSECQSWPTSEGGGSIGFGNVWEGGPAGGHHLKHTYVLRQRDPTRCAQWLRALCASTADRDDQGVSEPYHSEPYRISRRSENAICLFHKLQNVYA